MDLKFAKPRPHVLLKRERLAANAALDRQERKKCRLRSGGQCEVVVALFQPEASMIIYRRCRRRAAHNHHLISGSGRRGRGVSLSSAHRIDVCKECHQDLHAKILVPLFLDPAYQYDASKVRYERRTL